MIGRAELFGLAFLAATVFAVCDTTSPPAPPQAATTPTSTMAGTPTATATQSTPARTPTRTATIIAHCYDPVFEGVTGCPGPAGPLRIATQLDCTWNPGPSTGTYHVRARLTGDGRPVPRKKLDWLLPDGVQAELIDPASNGYTDFRGIVALTLTAPADTPMPLRLTARYPGTPPRGGVSTIGEPSMCTVEIGR